MHLYAYTIYKTVHKWTNNIGIIIHSSLDVLWPGILARTKWTNYTNKGKFRSQAYTYNVNRARTLCSFSWFLGELSDEVAAATLNNNGGMNTFAVYNNPEKNILTLAIRRPDGFEIRAITCEEGSYQITGQVSIGWKEKHLAVCCVFSQHLSQPDAHPDISTAVTRFAETQNLTPAFDGAVAAQLVSSTDVPPSYSQADRALQVRNDG